jgi:hypothetical protein
MEKLKFLFGTALLTALNLSLTANVSFSAAKCQALNAVKGDGTEVQKTVTPPTIPISIGNFFNNNWNTDFAVPSNVNFRQYIVTLVPESDGEYSIKMYLKYSDGTADEFYNDTPTLSTGVPLKLTGTPRLNAQPYQVNLFVGDLPSVGKSFTASVAGCK